MSIILGLLVLTALFIAFKIFGVSNAAIDTMKRANPSVASIDQYLYNWKLVYYVTSTGADMMNNVYSENGEFIGSPSGGLTGRGDGKLLDWNTASYIRNIWSKGGSATK